MDWPIYGVTMCACMQLAYHAVHNMRLYKRGLICITPSMCSFYITRGYCVLDGHWSADMYIPFGFLVQAYLRKEGYSSSESNFTCVCCYVVVALAEAMCDSS